MRRIVIVVAIVSAALAGCATVAPMDATDAPIRYSCKAGKRFTAAYALHGKRVVVSMRRRHQDPQAGQVRLRGALYGGSGRDLEQG